MSRSSSSTTFMKNRAARVLALLICLALPIQFPAGTPAFAGAGDSHVHERLNSLERTVAIEEARKLEAAAREAFEPAESAPDAGPVEVFSGTAAAPQVFAESAPEYRQEEPPYLPGRAEEPTGDEGAPERPRSLGAVLFNGVTGFVGLPGLVDPQDPYADQGLGFHQDGTARRADGTTGANSAAASFDGRRAASYLGHGLGYSVGAYGQNFEGGLNYYGAGYDPVTGYNFRLGDPSIRRPVSLDDDNDPFGFNDPQSYFLQRGLNYGLGLANSMGESAFAGLTDNGRARFNFMVDLDGRINGEGDILYPFYDGQYTTVFMQAGARSMSGNSGGGKDGRGGDRWIGNFGLGQRWFPAATLAPDGKTVLSGEWMLGYNLFFDNDFTRSHRRGGLGLEAQYDWFRLASNFYFPLSGWKGSYDFDSDFVEERPAKGWDLRVKGQLPFERSLAITGAYTRWYGDHVAMFSSSKLERDPRVWSYGLEYAPVPLVSCFVNQRSTERGRNDTEFGMRMTYRFGMSWEDQISTRKAGELNSVDASRHEFVDRENRIILEYRAKNNFYVEYVGMIGVNTFKFRLKHPFDEYIAGQTVRVSAGGGVTLAEAAPERPQTLLAGIIEFLDGLISVNAAHAAETVKSYVSDDNGEFVVRLDEVSALPVVVSIQAGNSTHTFTLHEATLTASLTAAHNRILKTSTALLTFDGKAGSAGQSVAWSVTSGPATLSGEQTTTDGNGRATATLTPTGLSLGPVQVKATVNGKDYFVTVEVVEASLRAPSATILKGGSVTLAFDGTSANANLQADWQSFSPDGVLSAQQTRTDAEGRATAVLTAGPTASGSLLVSVTVGGQIYTVSLNVVDIALTASAVSIPNGGSATLTLDGTAANAGQAVVWTLVSGPGALSAQQNTTDGAGRATATLTGHASGSGPAQVKASMGGQDYLVSVTVGVNGTLTAAAPNVPNNTEVLLTFEGPDYAGKNMTWEVVSGPVSFSSRQMTVGADGKATARLKGNSSGTGRATVRVTVEGDAFDLTLIVGPMPKVTAATSTLVGGGSTLLTLASQSWNAGKPVTWQVSGSAVLTGQQNVTDGGGVATATLTALGSGGGSITVKATVEGFECPVSVTVIEDVGSLETVRETLVNNGRSKLTFTSSSASGNQPVEWEIVSGPGGSFTDKYPSTDANGKVTADLVAPASGLGPILVRLKINGKAYEATVTVIEPQLTVSKPTLTNNGTAELLFTSANAYIGGDVKWEVSPPSLGTIMNPNPPSGASYNGIYTATFSAAPSGTGTATIKIQARQTSAQPYTDYTVTVDVIQVPVELTASTNSVGNGGVAVLTLEGGAAKAGKAVSWNATGPGALSAQQAVTDSNGRATARLTANPSGSGNIVATATVDGVSYPVTVELGATTFNLEVSYDRASFVSSDFKATATVTAKVAVGGSPVAVGSVDWEVMNSTITESWWRNRTPGAMNGLYWGATPRVLTHPDKIRENMTGHAGTVPTGAVAQLTDVVGSRAVRLKATTVISGLTYVAIADIRFGPGPLSAFRDVPTKAKTWAQAGNICGSAGNPANPGYQISTGLGTVAQLQNVFGGKYGAANAANWTIGGYWSGEVANVPSRDGVYTVGSAESGTGYINVFQTTYSQVICIRR